MSQARVTALAPLLGRRPITSRAHLEHVGLRLFTDYGFEDTTVDRIAAVAGISRRTFFRYFTSKNDLPWGEFDARLDWLRDRLRGAPHGQPVAEAIVDAVTEFNLVPKEEEPWHRERMALLLHVPALQAHSTLRYHDWRNVIADFVAERRRESPGDLIPRTAGYLALGASLAAYEQWLTNEDLDLSSLLRESFSLLGAGIPD